MAVLARDELTLASINDVSYVRRYFLSQASTLSPPPTPTVNPAPSPWVTTEPSYTPGSTNSLYVTDLFVFSDGGFDYIPVQLSSSYEAAKQAHNAAVAAATAATNAQTSANGKNNIVVNLNNASGTTNPDTSQPNVKGDIWNKVDSFSTYNTIASWVWDGSAWKASLIKNEMIHGLDVVKLTASTARMNQAVIDKIVADIGFFNSIVTGSAIADSISTAIANIVQARVENLTVTTGAEIASAVINKLAAGLITSSQLQTPIDSVTKLQSVMDTNGFRLLDMTDPANPVELVRIGPSGANLLQIGSVTIDAGGGVSGKHGSFETLYVNGRPAPSNFDIFPRGIVSWGELAKGRYSAQRTGRDQVLGLDAWLEHGRVYRLRSNQWTVGTQSASVQPFLQLHYTLSGTPGVPGPWPGVNWDNSRYGESAFGGTYGGWKTLPGMEVFIDMRGYPPSTSKTNLRAAVTLTGIGGWAQVSALFGPALLVCEDVGVDFPALGGPAYDTDTPPVKTRTVQRFYANNWATYTNAAGGARDTSSTQVTQGQYSTINRCGFYYFPSMTSALAGATIHRITMRAYADHWYNANGGIAWWCWHGESGITSTRPDHWFMVETFWPRNAPMDRDIIPSEFAAWQNGTRKGFGFATTNTAHTHYGKMTSNLGAVWVEVDYER